MEYCFTIIRFMCHGQKHRTEQSGKQCVSNRRFKYLKKVQMCQIELMSRDKTLVWWIRLVKLEQIVTEYPQGMTPDIPKSILNQADGEFWRSEIQSGHVGSSKIRQPCDLLRMLQLNLNRNMPRRNPHPLVHLIKESWSAMLIGRGCVMIH